MLVNCSKDLSAAIGFTQPSANESSETLVLFLRKEDLCLKHYFTYNKYLLLFLIFNTYYYVLHE